MADATSTTAAAETSSDSTEATAMEATTETPPTAEGEQQALGDAGKQALDRMKAERTTARAEAKAAKDALDALQAKLDGKEAEHLAALESQRVRDEALSKANDRIRKSEIKAAAKGVLQDPTDAYKYLDLEKFEVDDDGNVNETAITEALAELIKSRPYLGAQSGQRFQGSADGGARNGTQSNIDDQIAEATKAGNHQLAIALKQQRSADLLAKK